MLKWLRSRIHNLVKRKSNKNKKNTVIINTNRAKEQRLKKKYGEWVVYAEMVTYIIPKPKKQTFNKK